MKKYSFTFEQLVLEKLDKILSNQKRFHKELITMSAELDLLAQEVAETKGVQESVIVLLQGIQVKLDALAAELEAEGIDNAKVLALSEELSDSTDALAAAAATIPE
jgi:hypothetical protein